jgi:hypothetical protein
MRPADELARALENLPDRIARELFTCGSGKAADRLQLRGRNNEDLGGWGYGPARDRIAKVITETMSLKGGQSK